jgi:hypothetical protein
MVFTKGGPPGNPNGRPAGSPNKLNKQNFNKRLTDVEEELARLKTMLPPGMAAEDYIAGRDSAQALLGKK